MLLSIISIMRSGKTLYSVIYATCYQRLYPKNKIYANFHLKGFKNFIYRPFLLFSESELENCLIIIDDADCMDNIKNYATMIVNRSGKLDIHILITCQYFSQIPKKIREVSAFKVFVEYNKDNYRLDLIFIPTQENFIKIKGLFKQPQQMRIINCNEFYKLYNTKEVVQTITNSRVVKAIKKISKNKSDIEMNIELIFRDKVKQKQLKKELL